MEKSGLFMSKKKKEKSGSFKKKKKREVGLVILLEKCTCFVEVSKEFTLYLDE